MSYYKGGHNKLAKVCNQVLNPTQKNPQSSANIASSTSFYLLLSGLVRHFRTRSVAMS
jgi:hypothetical protein